MIYTLFYSRVIKTIHYTYLECKPVFKKTAQNYCCPLQCQVPQVGLKTMSTSFFKAWNNSSQLNIEYKLATVDQSGLRK